MATFVRLLGLLRPYRRGVVLSGLLAAVAMVMTVAIPWLTGRAIDQIRAGDKRGLDDARAASIARRRRRCASALTVARRLSPAGSRWASSSTCATACTGTCRRSSSASSTASRPGS